MPDTTTRAQEIMAELGKLAPVPKPADPDSAAALARYLATEAQLLYTRLMAPDAAADPASTGVLGAYFAAAFAASRTLAAMAELAPPVADELATAIVEGWDDGLSAGEWIADYLGNDAERIGGLAEQLAEATVKPAAAAGVVVDPEDLRAVLEDTELACSTDATFAAWNRLRDSAGLAGDPR